MWINGAFLITAALSLLSNRVYSSPVLNTSDDQRHVLVHANENTSTAVVDPVVARTTKKRTHGEHAIDKHATKQVEKRTRHSKEITVDPVVARTTKNIKHGEHAIDRHATEQVGKRTRHSKEITVDPVVARTTKNRTHGEHAIYKHATEQVGKRTRNSKEITEESVKRKLKRRRSRSKVKVKGLRQFRKHDRGSKIREGHKRRKYGRRKKGRRNRVRKKKKMLSKDQMGHEESEHEADDNSSLNTKELLNDAIKHHSKGHRLPGKVLKLLREALLKHPFGTWKYGARFDSASDLGVQEAQLHDIIENKWNKRMEEKLEKVLKGEDIHLAIFGGSNAVGGGIEDEEGDTSGIFYRVIMDWWRKTILPITGSHLKVRLIAMGGTASDFFQYCYENYLQDHVDLVFLELAVNDLKALPNNVNLSLPIEQLTRQLLMHPTHPALLYVNLFSGRTYHQGCVSLEDYGQGLLSDTYKITTFSWRDAVCPKVSGNVRVPLPSCGVVCRDGHHINLRGHAHISLMVINLFRDLILDRMTHGHKRLLGLFEDKHDLPAPVFIPHIENLVQSPKCWTTVSPQGSPQGGKVKIKNGMEVGVMENFGFDYLHEVKIGGSKCQGEPKFCRKDTYSGWSGKDAGAYLRLSFTVPARSDSGDDRFANSRSVAFATRTCSHCGGANVWLDDDFMNRKYVLGKSYYAQTLIEVIAKRVAPGDHTMSVRVVLPGEITAVGVMVGPPDGPF